MELTDKEKLYLNKVGFKHDEINGYVYADATCYYTITKEETYYKIEVFFIFEDDSEDTDFCLSNKDESIENFVERILNI
jgi:hypothetical protein